MFVAKAEAEQVQNTGPQDFRPIRGFMALHAPTARVLLLYNAMTPK